MSNTTDKVGFNHFELKTTYEEMLAAGQVDENDISFVKDAGEIHVLGGTYGGVTAADLEALATKDEVIANEEVTAAALNELNDRVNEIAANVGGSAATKEELAAAVATLEAADTATNESINAVDGKVDALEASVAETYSTKTELQNEVDTLNGTITALQNEVIDNEEITAAALNDINDRVNQLGADSEVTYTTKTELQEVVATINNTIIDNEEITAAALSDLDARIKDLISRLEALTTQSSVLSGALEIDEDGDLHSTTGIYSDTFISARGKDANV